MRLLDADALPKYTGYALSADEVAMAVENAPTINAVEVVRCKDCKWYESDRLKRDGTTDKRYKSNVCVRGTYAELRNADWFCADGERREDDEPVKYGRWIRNDNGTYSCSQCHSWIPDEQHYYARYCLFCGAKMDGERREDEGNL